MVREKVEKRKARRSCDSSSQLGLLCGILRSFRSYRSEHEAILPVSSVGAGLVEEVFVPGPDGGREENPADER